MRPKKIIENINIEHALDFMTPAANCRPIYRKLWHKWRAGELGANRYFGVKILNLLKESLSEKSKGAIVNYEPSRMIMSNSRQTGKTQMRNKWNTIK